MKAVEADFHVVITQPNPIPEERFIFACTIDDTYYALIESREGWFCVARLLPDGKYAVVLQTPREFFRELQESKTL